MPKLQIAGFHFVALFVLDLPSRIEFIIKQTAYQEQIHHLIPSPFPSPLRESAPIPFGLIKLASCSISIHDDMIVFILTCIHYDKQSTDVK